jgi:hypothetical protein
LTIFVEGKGDVGAVPQLAKRLIQMYGGFDALYLDAEPFRVGNLGALVKDDCRNWKRWLGAASRKVPFAGVLLVLDGDTDNDRVPPGWASYSKRFGHDFCAYRVGAQLASAARDVGAGAGFSVATVFAMKEFESWIISGIEGIRGVALASDRGKVDLTVSYPVGKEVENTRGAKELLVKQVPEYKPSLDQAILAANLDLYRAIERSRSCRRLSDALLMLISATRKNSPVLSPVID